MHSREYIRREIGAQSFSKIFLFSLKKVDSREQVFEWQQEHAVICRFALIIVSFLFMIFLITSATASTLLVECLITKLMFFMVVFILNFLHIHELEAYAGCCIMSKC